MLYNSYVQIKTLIKRDSITLATKHTTITTIFKYMPPTTLTSHCTHTHRNPYSTPGTNTNITGSVHQFTVPLECAVMQLPSLSSYSKL